MKIPSSSGKHHALEDCFDSIKIEQVKAAHFLQEEKPREVAELMNRFFK
jgi:hypothetical protein